MIYHILNGDALAGGFDVEGEVIICREALIEGDVGADGRGEFWDVRARVFDDGGEGGSYFERVKSEFDKLGNVEAGDEVNLWFGNDAFCQVNLWFCLRLLAETEARLFRVMPDSGGWDCSFHDLRACIAARQALTEEDLQLGGKLWQAFAAKDFAALKELGENGSDRFPRLGEVCQALIEQDSRPAAVLREIVEEGEEDFGRIFLRFRERAGVYGFGDSQVRNLLEAS